MAHIIESVPQPLNKVDAFAVLPGLGEHIRLTTAIHAWETHAQARLLLVAGTNQNERTQQQPTLSFLQRAPIGLRKTEGVVTQVSAQHTREQSEWLAEQISTLGITSLALFVSHWHLPRAYGTLIKTMQGRHDEHVVPVFPVPVATPPDAIIPETNATVVEMSAGEAMRIQKYQTLGHVATLAELADYLSWLWTQDIVPIHA